MTCFTACESTPAYNNVVTFVIMAFDDELATTIVGFIVEFAHV